MAGNVVQVEIAGITAEQMAVHVRRVELLVSLVTGVIVSAKENPLFGGMIPDELLTELAELNSQKA